MAKLETISETAIPAPWRLACRRTNQLPIPASGASSTRLGTRDAADVQRATVELLRYLCPLARCARADRRRPVSVRRSSVSSISSQNGTMCAARPPVAIASRLARRARRAAAEDRVDLAGVAVHRRPSGSRRPWSCRSASAAATRSMRGSAAARAVSASMRDLDAGRDDPAEVLAVVGDGSKVMRRAEVDDAAAGRTRS